MQAVVKKHLVEAAIANGPKPIAPELLRLIGGGKSSPTEPAKPTAPVNKW